jgi:8-oxo-dGTP pyrophosphatase MutT (NUDIX family)
VIYALIQNQLFQMEEFYLVFSTLGSYGTTFDDYLSTLPRANVYHPMWNHESYTTGGIIPYIRKENSEKEVIIGLSISSYSVLTYLGGTREKGEYILETTVREFEEETRHALGGHFFPSISIGQLHGLPYAMKSKATVVLFFWQCHLNPYYLMKAASESENPETNGILWLTWPQLNEIMDRVRAPSQIQHKAFYPFVMSNKLKSTLM